MKKNILLISVMFSIGCAFAQKPVYTIDVKRSDTLMGSIEVEMFPLIAPLHVANWDSIVVSGGYDSTAFHRVVPGFVIQGGDPNSVSGPVNTWGYGDPNQANVPAEFSEVPHARGILSAARSTDPNSATSQYFICVANAFSLDNNYSVYGQVVSGMDVVDLIVAAPVTSGTERPADKISMFITRTGTNDSVPDAPTLSAPAANATNVASSTSFSWTAVGDAKLYRLEVATDNAFTNVVYTRNTKYTFSTVPGLDGFTTYYWRVRANNGGHLSANPEVRSFTSGIGITTLLLPEDLSLTSNRPFLDWEDVQGAVKYRVQVSQMATFANPLANIIDTVIDDFSHLKVPSFLELSKKHYWRVLGVDADNNIGQYSDIWEFTPNVVAALASDMDDRLQVFPNPADDVVHMSVTAPTVVSIYHCNGALMLQTTLFTGVTAVDISSLSDGMYYYQAEQLGEVYTGKLLKR